MVLALYGSGEKWVVYPPGVHDESIYMIKDHLDGFFLLILYELIDNPVPFS